MAVPPVALIVVPSAAVILPLAAIPQAQSPEVAPIAFITPLLIVIFPPLFNIAAEWFVVAVTFALIVMSPFNVPIQVLEDVASTLALILIPFCAPMAT